MNDPERPRRPCPARRSPWLAGRLRHHRPSAERRPATSTAGAPRRRRDCADDDGRPSTGPVSLTDAFGRTVELDAPAERVAVLEWQQVEDVLTLCVTPVAVADAEGYAHLGHRRGAARRRRGRRRARRAEPRRALRHRPRPRHHRGLRPPTTRSSRQLEEYGVPVLATKGADAADPVAEHARHVRAHRRGHRPRGAGRRGHRGVRGRPGRAPRTRGRRRPSCRRPSSSTSTAGSRAATSPSGRSARARWWASSARRSA